MPRPIKVLKCWGRSKCWNDEADQSVEMLGSIKVLKYRGRSKCWNAWVDQSVEIPRPIKVLKCLGRSKCWNAEADQSVEMLGSIKVLKCRGRSKCWNAEVDQNVEMPRPIKVLKCWGRSKCWNDEADQSVEMLGSIKVLKYRGWSKCWNAWVDQSVEMPRPIKVLKCLGRSKCWNAEADQSVEMLGFIKVLKCWGRSKCWNTEASFPILSAPTAVGIIVTLIFLSFFSSLARFKYLSIFLLSFIFILWITGRVKSTKWQFFFFFFFFFFFLLLLLLLLLLFLVSFSHQHLMVFHWSLRDSKSPQVSNTLLNLLADLSLNGLHSSCYFQLHKSLYQSFGNCTKSTSYNWYNRHLHVPHFLQFLGKVVVFIPLFTFFQLYSVISQDSKVHNSAGFLFLLIFIRSGRLAEIRWSVCITKSQRCWCVSFSMTDAGFFIVTLMFHKFFSFLARFKYLYSFSLYFHRDVINYN